MVNQHENKIILEFGNICTYKNKKLEENYCILVSSNTCLKYSDTIMVIPIELTTENKKLPTHIFINDNIDFKFQNIAIAKIENIHSIDKKYIIEKVGNCNEKLETEILTAMRLTIG